MATAFKKGDKVTVAGTKTNPSRRPGTFVATHSGIKGDFLEVMLVGSTTTTKFRPALVEAD